MKIKNVVYPVVSGIILGSLSITPGLFAGQTAYKEDLKPGVTIQVDGLTCPFCAYGLEKRVKELPDVEKSIINVKDSRVEVFPKEGSRIDVDKLKAAIKAGGFTPREVQVTLIGTLVQWEGMSALSSVSRGGSADKWEVMYLLEENDLLAKLKTSVGSSTRQVLITGQAEKRTPRRHTDHPYTIVIESFHPF